jgi:hypothetical protein
MCCVPLLCCNRSQQSDSALGKPMTEQELAVLRKAMGVNSYGTFVDRSAANPKLDSSYCTGYCWTPAFDCMSSSTASSSIQQEVHCSAHGVVACVTCV